MTISVKILASGTAIYQKDFAFSDTMTFDETLKIIHLRFDIGDSLQFIELTILDDNVKGPASLQVATVNSNGFADLWLKPGSLTMNKVFKAVDDLFGDAEYDQKCDFAAPTGACTYACELDGGLTSGLDAYNVLDLGGDDYIIRMNGGFTVSLWTKATRTDSNACLYSYPGTSSTAPVVPLVLCNLNADSDVSDLPTFVNIWDNVWYFVVVTWNAEDALLLYDNDAGVRWMALSTKNDYRFQRSLHSRQWTDSSDPTRSRLVSPSHVWSYRESSRGLFALSGMG
ncbi:hypothetical protein F444_23107 [Phytophthora nicotianae P1976]|uniref:Uncharacterized protein n=1 Tax=Phytophthora nicotianae P1976 TaxID=1317066 RepID=A0A080YVV2_PHYNI|nr:hypothetical protein F444_23107 [Phytophthora nicotianae P1976]